jgi:uncharacterized membrane protein
LFSTGLTLVTVQFENGMSQLCELLKAAFLLKIKFKTQGKAKVRIQNKIQDLVGICVKFRAKTRRAQNCPRTATRAIAYHEAES